MLFIFIVKNDRERSRMRANTQDRKRGISLKKSEILLVKKGVNDWRVAEIMPQRNG
jgi:hypothetical protein